MWIRVFFISYGMTRSYFQAFMFLRKIIGSKKNLLQDNPINKLIKVDGKYYWDQYHAGFPGRSFDNDIKWLLQKEKDGDLTGNTLRFVMLAITKKCPLNCEHCYEWDEINQKEVLSPDELNQIVSKYQDLGATQFFLGGGEPLSRFNDLLVLLQNSSDHSDFWLSTSAYNLTFDKAKALKKAGLTGVIISLDHFSEKKHNQFRGNQRSFEYVIEGCVHAESAGLVVSLSVCTTRSFVSKENLYSYLKLGEELNVGFIQLVEPRAEGRYGGKDVELREKEYKILDDFYLTVNNQSKYAQYPKIVHPSFDQRKFGCAGAGSNFIMIDTDGRINACPFCRKKGSHALDRDLSSHLHEIAAEGCYKFDDRIKN